jgi:uncharacterized protein (TIGR02246 family)
MTSGEIHSTTLFHLAETAALLQTRIATLGLVEGLSQQEFDWTPGAGKWSIGEVLDHLLRAEQFFRRDLEQLAEALQARRPMHIRHSFRDLDIGIPFVPKSWMPALDLPLTFAMFFVPPTMVNFIASSRMFPMSHPAVAEPERGRPAEALRRELWDAWQQTSQILEQIPAAEAARMTVAHPLLGTRTVPELIQFIAHHELRHQGQIVARKEMLKSGDESRSRRLSAEQAIRDLYGRISDAWSRGDARRIAQQFAPDGDLFDPTSGVVHRGRAAVEALLKRRFAAAPFRGSKITFRPQTIRLITLDGTISVADGTWEVTGMRGPADQVLPPLGGPLTTVFRKDHEQWRVEADRPMPPTDSQRKAVPPD